MLAPPCTSWSRLLVCGCWDPAGGATTGGWWVKGGAGRHIRPLLTRHQPTGHTPLDPPTHLQSIIIREIFPQVIQWVQEPTDTNTLRDFQQWKEKCDVKVISFFPFHPFACLLAWSFVRHFYESHVVKTYMKMVSVANMRSGGNLENEMGISWEGGGSQASLRNKFFSL